MNYQYDIAVIGAGAAGLTVASGAAQLGAKTLLIEKEKVLGGDCLHYGCVPSKTLIRTAEVCHLIRNSEQYGLPKATIGPVDFEQVSKRIQSVIEIIQKHDSVERFNSLGVEVKFGNSVFHDSHTIELEGQKISAAKWVIATGSSAALRPIKGLANVSYLTNREIFSLSELPKHLIILGTGPIGIEMAQAFGMLGSKVSVVGRSEQILTKEDKDLADILMRQLEKLGVKFYLNTTVKEISEPGNYKILQLEQEGNPVEISGDQLLVAQGQSPHVGGMGLIKIGLNFSEKGIPVDNRMRTNIHHIFAAGDITGKYPFTHAAGYEGGVIVANAIMRLPRKTNYKWLPWCTYGLFELASIGMNEKRAQQAGVRYKTITETFASNDRALAEKHSEGLIKILLDQKNKPMGAQILGPHAGELLGEWVSALNGRVKLSTLAGAIHPYPTLSEINKKVISNMYGEKIFSPRVRKILKLLFKYRG